MITRISHSGPITVGIPYEIRAKRSAFILVRSSGTFVATLYHLCNKSDNTEYDISDFEQLAPVVSFSDANNYKQTLGGGNYAIVFTAASTDVTIAVTE